MTAWRGGCHILPQGTTAWQRAGKLREVHGFALCIKVKIDGATIHVKITLRIYLEEQTNRPGQLDLLNSYET